MQKGHEPEKPIVIQQVVILHYPPLSLAADPRKFDKKTVFLFSFKNSLFKLRVSYLTSF